MVTTRAASPLRTFLVECYAPGATRDGIAATGGRLRAAAESLRRAGREVEYAGSLLVSEDEVVIHIFHSRDPDAVRELVAQTPLACERIVESVPIELEWTQPPAGRAARRSVSEPDRARSPTSRPRR
jgi:hypothetical protein